MKTIKTRHSKLALIAVLLVMLQVAGICQATSDSYEYRIRNDYSFLGKTLHLKAGDRLVKINGISLTSPDGFWDMCESMSESSKKGSPIKVVFRRNGLLLEKDVLVKPSVENPQVKTLYR